MLCSVLLDNTGAWRKIQLNRAWLRRHTCADARQFSRGFAAVSFRVLGNPSVEPNLYWEVLMVVSRVLRLDQIDVREFLKRLVKGPKNPR